MDDVLMVGFKINPDSLLLDVGIVTGKYPVWAIRKRNSCAPIDVVTKKGTYIRTPKTLEIIY